MNIHGFSLFIGKRIYNMQNNAADKLSPFKKLTIEQQNLITQIISFTKQHINRNFPAIFTSVFVVPIPSLVPIPAQQIIIVVFSCRFFGIIISSFILR